MIRRLLFGLVLAAAAAAPAQSNAAITVLDFGIYKLSVERQVKAEGDVSGQRNVVANIRLFQRTRTVFAQLGRSFGYRFRVADPKLQGRLLTLRTIFPKLRNPRTGRSGTSQSRTFTAMAGSVYYDGYRFDHRWELAEGYWRFQILDGGKLIHEEKLRVVVPLN